MSKSYAEIIGQIEKLKDQAQAVRRKEIDEVVGRIREAIAVYGLTEVDIFSKRRATPGPKPTATRKSPKAAASSGGGRPNATGARHYKSYADSDGHTWGGIGPRPAWLRSQIDNGKKLEDFLVS